MRTGLFIGKASMFWLRISPWTIFNPVRAGFCSNTLINNGSISTETRFFTFGKIRSVNAPTPGPISKKLSSALGSIVSTIFFI